VSGSPVVLVHGFATSADRTWRDNGWIDLLADSGRRVVAPDLLGHGHAPKPHDPAAYDELESRLVDALPEGPVDAIGFSLGARVLLTIAADEPDRFDRLVLAGVGANLFRDDDPELIAQSILGEADTANPVAQYFRGLASAPDTDPHALVAYLRRPGHHPLTDEGLARITCPVLVVLGDQDFAGPADPLLERLPNARLVSLRGVDHFATPKSFAFIDATLEFLDAQLS
jgi:pimeloyl-ACP methyl ester carboxylesterase